MFGVDTNCNLDSAILASEDGLHWLYYDCSSNSWKTEFIGKG